MSVLLDTNVLSQILRGTPDPKVLAWFSKQGDGPLFVSAITQTEMFLGARLLPDGKRRQRLQAALHGLFETDFAHRVRPFDGAAVTSYVDVVAARRLAGRPVSQFDAQIAAIALSSHLAVATRNVRDFDGCALRVIDPWS